MVKGQCFLTDEKGRSVAVKQLEALHGPYSFVFILHPKEALCFLRELLEFIFLYCDITYYP